MKIDFPRPMIFVSRCLGFEACRWDGQIVKDPIVEALSEYADIVSVCPEKEIGLGIPRHPVRLVDSAEGIRLMQPASGADITGAMRSFSETYISELGRIDGAVMKFRSPSCGLAQVKVYQRIDKSSHTKKDAGIFASRLMLAVPNLPAEDEGRLKNYIIREHFFTRIFLSARLHGVIQSGKMGSLVAFHASCKYLLMAYSQKHLRILGRLVAEGTSLSWDDLVLQYLDVFHAALAEPYKEGAAVNVIQHMAGYFSDKLSAGEKSHFADILEEFLRGITPLSVPLGIINSWAERFQELYILDQLFLRPYPKGLVSITDSGKGRDY